MSGVWAYSWRFNSFLLYYWRVWRWLLWYSAKVRWLTSYSAVWLYLSFDLVMFWCKYSRICFICCLYHCVRCHVTKICFDFGAWRHRMVCYWEFDTWKSFFRHCFFFTVWFCVFLFVFVVNVFFVMLDFSVHVVMFMYDLVQHSIFICMIIYKRFIHPCLICHSYCKGVKIKIIFPFLPGWHYNCLSSDVLFQHNGRPVYCRLFRTRVTYL